MDLTNEVRIAFDVECSVLKLCVDLLHGLEGVVLEYFLPNLVPQIFLRGQLGRIGREKMQHDVGGYVDIVAYMCACTILELQDYAPWTTTWPCFHGQVVAM